MINIGEMMSSFSKFRERIEKNKIAARRVRGEKFWSKLLGRKYKADQLSLRHKKRLEQRRKQQGSAEQLD